MTVKEPNQIDVLVGARLRLRRMALGMSQEKLGEGLGLTFQQVQKYEKGSNRIGASRLWEISCILDAPISYFFEGATNIKSSGQGSGQIIGFREEDPANFMFDFLATNEGLELNKAFRRIKDVRLRRKIVDLLRTLVNDDVGAD